MLSKPFVQHIVLTEHRANVGISGLTLQQSEVQQWIRASPFADKIKHLDSEATRDGRGMDFTVKHRYRVTDPTAAMLFKLTWGGA